MFDKKLWELKNRNRVLELKRKYFQRWRLCIREGGKVRCIKLEKPRRPKPDRCEFCGRATKLEYHHWLPSKPYIGMWICRPCHKFVTLIEHGEDQRYRQLKMQIESTYS